MILNSKMKQKSKTILGVIRNLVPDFILYFVTAYIVVYNGVFWDTLDRTQNNNHKKPKPEQNTLKLTKIPQFN